MILAITISIGILSDCKKEDPKITIEKISGSIQKGPFISGSSIQISELDSKLFQTGKTFSGFTSNSLGYYEITDLVLSSAYLDVSASGFYFDEVNNVKSISPLNLSAVTNVTDNTLINLNILTTLEKPRVKYLMEKSVSFTEAKQMAQSEVLAFFGILSKGMEPSETLDISQEGDANAALLAVSLILHGNRSVGDLSELLYNISSEIREDGSFFNEGIMTDLRNSAAGLKLPLIRTNLENYYKDLGVTVTLPAFENYIFAFLKFTGETPTVKVLPATEIGTISARLNAEVNPNTLSTQVVFTYGLNGNFNGSINAKEGGKSGSEPLIFTADVNGLIPGRIYNFKVKATNAKGTVTTDSVEFTTLGELPGVSINAAKSITQSTAVLSGQVDCKKLLTDVSFEYGPTTEYFYSVTAAKDPVSSNEIVNVSVIIKGLTPATLFHFRIKADNALGTEYSNDMEFTTALGPYKGTVQDIDGNIYKTVGIGSQIWTAENLKVKKYNDGTNIPIVSDSAVWSNTTTPAYSYYWYAPEYLNTYGAFYNWYAVNTGKLCPAGWHVPEKAEWDTLVEYLGGKYEAGGKLKSKGYWVYTDLQNNDEYEFNAIPSGNGSYNGGFMGMGYSAAWWSSDDVNSTESRSLGLWYENNTTDNWTDNNKGNAYSVRCVKD